MVYCHRISGIEMRANGLLGTAKPGHIETSDHSDVTKRYIDRLIYIAPINSTVTKRFGHPNK